MKSSPNTLTMFQTTITCFVLLLAGSALQAQTIYYVDGNRENSGDGTS